MERASEALHAVIDTAEGFAPMFSWKNGSYPCIFNWNEQSYLNQGGQIPLDELTLQVLRSEFNEGPIPQLKDTVVFTDDPANTPEREFVIELVQRTPGNYLKLVCRDPAAGS
jgi:hypothetical protein